MIKDDIVKQIAKSLQIKLDDAKTITETILDGIVKSFSSNDKLVIINFGTFKRKHKKARLGRNPKNGTLYKISERSVVSFHPSQQFSDELLEKTNKKT